MLDYTPKYKVVEEEYDKKKGVVRPFILTPTHWQNIWSVDKKFYQQHEEILIKLMERAYLEGFMAGLDTIRDYVYSFPLKYFNGKFEREE